jgi:hypothetical protein
MRALKREIPTHSHDARPSAQDRTRRAAERAPACGHQGRRPARVYGVGRRDHHQSRSVAHISIGKSRTRGYPRSRGQDCWRRMCNVNGSAAQWGPISSDERNKSSSQGFSLEVRRRLERSWRGARIGARRSAPRLRLTAPRAWRAIRTRRSALRRSRSRNHRARSRLRK